MNQLRAFRTALAFLTVLPSRSGSVADEDLARSLGYFPLVGLIIGLGLAVVSSILPQFSSAPVTALCIVSLLVVATGGLHIDGLADTFDGLGGSRNPEHALAIMRDSRIGALGATALFLTLAIKTAAISELVAQQQTWMVLSFPALARWATAIIVVAYPYVRPLGLGTPFRLAAPRDVLMATIWIVPIVIVRRDLRWAALGTVVTALLFASWVQRRVGGLTGDAYGAAIELGETAALLLASIDP